MFSLDSVSFSRQSYCQSIHPARSPYPSGRPNPSPTSSFVTIPLIANLCSASRANFNGARDPPRSSFLIFRSLSPFFIINRHVSPRSHPTHQASTTARILRYVMLLIQDILYNYSSTVIRVHPRFSYSISPSAVYFFFLLFFIPFPSRYHYAVSASDLRSPYYVLPIHWGNPLLFVENEKAMRREE